MLQMQEIFSWDVDIQIQNILRNVKQERNITVGTHAHESVVKIYVNCVLSVDLHIYEGRMQGDICGVGKRKVTTTFCHRNEGSKFMEGRFGRMVG